VSLRPAGLVLAWSLVLFWGFAGIGKLIELGTTADPATPTTWADQFGAPLIVVAAASEALAALLVFAGFTRTGLLLTLGLLATFSVALVVSPPEAGQACGCGGSVAIDSADPLIRNAVLSAVTMLGLVLIASRR